MNFVKRFNRLPALLLPVILVSGQVVAQKAEKHGVNLLNHHEGQPDPSLVWVNPPSIWNQEGQGLSVTAEKGTDFFIDPENGKSTATAPVFCKEVKGDFVALARVKPDFSAQWNACALMLLIDETNWIKLAFENSDATGAGIVSVVTREVSDDANGVILEGREDIWLKLVRKGNVYGMFWSTDGEDFYMVRIARMKEDALVKVGLEAQCPVGEGADHHWSHFSVENKTVDDLRKGY